MELLEYLESHDSIPDTDEGSVILEYIRDIGSFLNKKYYAFYSPLKQYIAYQDEHSYEKIVGLIAVILDAAHDLESFESAYIDENISKYLNPDTKEYDYHACFFEDMNDTKYIDLYKEESVYDELKKLAITENANRYFNRNVID